MAAATHDLIASAKKINDNASCEADWRAACSRSYYAVFGASKTFHETLPSPGSLGATPSVGMHGSVISQLSNPTVSSSDIRLKSKKIGYILKSMYEKRIRSDYKLDQDVSLEDAMNALAECEQLSNLLAAPAAATSTPAGTSGLPHLKRIK